VSGLLRNGCPECPGIRRRRPLDVWVYEKWDITLLFNGLRLVAWKTDKTREELKTIPKEKGK
jgi:hypothetical protein